MEDIMKFRNLIFALVLFTMSFLVSFAPIKDKAVAEIKQNPTWNKTLGQRIEKPNKTILKFQSTIFFA